MSGNIKIGRMTNPKRPVGRPPKNEESAILHVAIPAWLRKLLDDAAKKEGRKINEEVSRRLKTTFGLEPFADKPPD